MLMFHYVSGVMPLILFKTYNLLWGIFKETINIDSVTTVKRPPLVLAMVTEKTAASNWDFYVVKLGRKSM